MSDILYIGSAWEDRTIRQAGIKEQVEGFDDCFSGSKPLSKKSAYDVEHEWLYPRPAAGYRGSFFQASYVLPRPPPPHRDHYTTRTHSADCISLATSKTKIINSATSKRTVSPNCYPVVTERNVINTFRKVIEAFVELEKQRRNTAWGTTKAQADDLGCIDCSPGSKDPAETSGHQKFSEYGSQQLPKRKANSSEGPTKKSRRKGDSSQPLVEERKESYQKTGRWFRCPYQAGNPGDHLDCLCYKTWARVRDHVRDKHIKRLVCDICGKFRHSKKWNLDRHKEACKKPIATAPPYRIDTSEENFLKSLQNVLEKKETTWIDFFNKLPNKRCDKASEYCQTPECPRCYRVPEDANLHQYSLSVPRTSTPSLSRPHSRPTTPYSSSPSTLPNTIRHTRQPTVQNEHHFSILSPDSLRWLKILEERERRLGEREKRFEVREGRLHDRERAVLIKETAVNEEAARQTLQFIENMIDHKCDCPLYSTIKQPLNSSTEESVTRTDQRPPAILATFSPTTDLPIPDTTSSTITTTPEWSHIPATTTAGFPPDADRYTTDATSQNTQLSTDSNHFTTGPPFTSAIFDSEESSFYSSDVLGRGVVLGSPSGLVETQLDENLLSLNTTPINPKPRPRIMPMNNDTRGSWGHMG